MTRKEFELLARDVLKKLPNEFKEKLQNVDVVIDASAKGNLLGLYEGIPLDKRTTNYGLVMPDKITLFKKNIELECKEQGLDIRKEIKHVIQHEIAHHFGISDKRLKDIGRY
jgi:predicted Zn-dependent protease with MMP-like domain